MNENIQDAINENENVESFEETIVTDLTQGLHSPLYCKINDVTIRDIRIRDAFTRFLKEVECGDSITVMDILTSAENYVKNGEADVNAGNLIFAYNPNKVKDNKFRAKLLKNSVGNIYSLFSIHNGVTVDLNAVGGTVATAESTYFLILPPKKVEKFNKSAINNGVELKKAGEVISTNRILLSTGNDVVASVDKSLLTSNSMSKIDIGTEHFPAFLSGYNAVCSLVLCNCISTNNIIRFGLGGTLSDIVARALGYFAALTYLKIAPIRIVFVADNDASVAVSRPKVADGDYLYLLKLRKDVYELPDKGHFGQLFYYLGEKKRMGIIKDVLPCGENINRVINRLCTDTLEYDKLNEIPKNCFGVIVSVGRGESVNGIKLGCFKNTL